MVDKLGQNLYHRVYVRGNRDCIGWICGSRNGLPVFQGGLGRFAASRGCRGIELICVDNRYSAKIAQRSADLLVREKVDLAIEFQTDEEVAPIVAASIGKPTSHDRD